MVIAALVELPKHMVMHDVGFPLPPSDYAKAIDEITERFTRAVDQLGSDQVAVRIGGIYALERIALNSPADRGPVTEVLCAFVRDRAAWNGVDDQDVPWTVCRHCAPASPTSKRP